MSIGVIASRARLCRGGRGLRRAGWRVGTGVHRSSRMLGLEYNKLKRLSGAAAADRSGQARTSGPRRPPSAQFVDLRVGVLACPHRGDEDLRPQDLPGHGIDDRDGIAWLASTISF